MAWFREMFGLLRQYREANRNYRWAMKQLKKQIKDQAHGRA